MRRGAGHRGATPGCRPRRQWRAQPHINKDFLINPIVHYRKSYFKFEMPGPFAVMRAARLVFAQSGRQGPRLSGLVAAHTGSPHCPGWRVAPGPMARRCSHLMMIAPAGRPTATKASPRRPEGLFGFQPNRLPGLLPVVALRMPYPPPILISPCPAVSAARMQPEGGRTMACTVQQAVGNRLPSDWAQSCERISRL